MQTGIPREGAGADGLAVADIALHQHPQQALRPLVEVLFSRLLLS